jgi:hypothetical protein
MKGGKENKTGGRILIKKKRTKTNRDERTEKQGTFGEEKQREPRGIFLCLEEQEEREESERTEKKTEAKIKTKEEDSNKKKEKDIRKIERRDEQRRGND